MNSFILSKQTNIAVKAIIYKEDGSILMQQRDVSLGLPFAGYWNFFGGLCEEESLVEGLRRELIEELGCVPGYIENEIFQWTWESDWASTSNHFFPVRFDDQQSINLQEGKDLRWVNLQDLVVLPLTPAVYENFSQIAAFLGKLSPDVILKIEEKLLTFNKLRKKNDRVFYAEENPCGLSRQQMFILKALAALKDVPVFRVCLHITDEADVHEMIMIHTRPSSVGPLKQNKTSLSYHIIEGSLLIELHGDDGKPPQEYCVSKTTAQNGDLISIRLKASQYRTVQSKSLFAIFIEIGSGPFVDNDTHWLNN